MSKFKLTKEDREKLQALSQSEDGTTRRRAEVILYAADGVSQPIIAEEVGYTYHTVKDVIKKFRQVGIEYITAGRPGRPAVNPPRKSPEGRAKLAADRKRQRHAKAGTAEATPTVEATVPRAYKQKSPAMASAAARKVVFTPADIDALTLIENDQTVHERVRFRAKVLKMVFAGSTFSEVREAVCGLSATTFENIMHLFRHYGTPGVYVRQHVNGKPQTFAEYAANTKKKAESEDDRIVKGVRLPDLAPKRSPKVPPLFPWRAGQTSVVGGLRELTEVCSAFSNEDLYRLSDAWWNDATSTGNIKGAYFTAKSKFIERLQKLSKTTILFGHEPKGIAAKFYWIGSGSVQRVLFPDMPTDPQPLRSGFVALPKTNAAEG